MQMQLSSDAQIPDGLLAANALLAENSRQGFGASTHTVYQGFGVAISSTAIGIPGTLYDGRVRCRYTGKERDAESGLDYFGARYYGANMGRFMSPDDGTDVNLNNPQSLNRYAYVHNNPLRNIDPFGHSTQTAANGDVLAVYNDNDLGVYRHGDIDNRADWDGSKLDNTDPETSKMGATRFWEEFAQLDGDTHGINGSSSGARIHFGVHIDSVIQQLNAEANKMVLAEVAIRSSHGGDFDIKTDANLTNGNVQEGYLLGDYYTSVRSAGNFLAGVNAATGSTLSPEQIQKIFGAYQQGGMIAAAKTAHTGNAAPGTSAPYWGEQQYSGQMQQIGIQVGVGQRKQ